MPTDTLDIIEAAAYLHFKPSYLYQLVSKGQISFSKPTNGKVLFLREDLEEFVRRGRRPADFEVSDRADRIALKAAKR